MKEHLETFKTILEEYEISDHLIGKLKYDEFVDIVGEMLDEIYALGRSEGEEYGYNEGYYESEKDGKASKTK